MDDTDTSGWAPILTSARGAAAAWEAIDAVTLAIVAGDYGRSYGRPHRAEDDALLYAYLGAARADESWAARATDTLNAAIDAVTDSPHPWPALYGGLCGLGWTLEHVSRLLDQEFPAASGVDSEPQGNHHEEQEVDLAADVDRAMLRRLERVALGAWAADYDLISGLVGFGTYFLERLPAETAGAGIRLVVEHLGAIAERSDQGITWHTPPELLPEWQRKQSPGGYYNLGVAHGIPGVIHFLSEAMAAGVERERARPLLDGAVNWLMGCRLPHGSASWFSAWLSAGHAASSRLAWCYGDLGILSVLLQVAWRTQRKDVRRFAGELLDHCLARQPEDCGVADAPLCHGAVGLAHIFNRLYQAENDVRCRDAAVSWFDRALSMRQPTSGAGGFLAATRPDPEGPTVWEKSPDFLDGAIGVALALLSAVTPIGPSWDRRLLVSGREWR